MRFTASLEVFDDESCVGWVHELPGCAATVGHRTEIERALAHEIRRFLAEGDEPVPDRIELAVAEEIEVAGEGAEATAALIAPDHRPLDPVGWARVARRLALSRQELLARLAAAPEADWPALRSELRHVGIVELLLAAQTHDTGTPEGLQRFLDWTRSVVMARMTGAASDDAGTPTGADGAAAETWTAAKVARRLVWHERRHLPPS